MEDLNKLPLGTLAEDYPLADIVAAQTSMVKWASHFSDPEIESLRYVIELSIEFWHYFSQVDIDTVDHEYLMYVNNSIISGLDSFTSLCQAYRSTAGETRSTLPQRVLSRAALIEEFITVYRQFGNQSNGEKRCRLLLDLFKLQIVFVGLTYD